MEQVRFKSGMEERWATFNCQVGNLPTNFGVSRTFRSQLIGRHLSDALRVLATLTFDLGGHGACR